MVCESSACVRQPRHCDVRDPVQGRVLPVCTPRSGKPLKGYEGLFSLPVTTPGGEHRILYQLKPEERIVYVVLVGPREEIYEILKRSGLK